MTIEISSDINQYKVISQPTKKKLAIVVPTQKFNLNNTEEEVIQRLSKLYSGQYSLYLVIPEDSTINYEERGFKNIYLDSKFFYNGIQGNNNLCFDVNFYKIFQNYNFMLMHHVDAIILKDEVEHWISKNYSYIGGPSFHKNLFTKEPIFPKYFCNGGLSLRKISDFIMVLNSKKIYFNQFDLNVIKSLMKFKHIHQYINLIFKNYKFKSNFDVQNFVNEYFLNEDFFWTMLAKLFIKNFRLPKNTLECANFSITQGYKFYSIKYGVRPFGIHGYTNKNDFLLKKLFSNYINT